MNDMIAIFLKTYDFRKNPFFVDLSNGEMSFDEFIRTQEQFYYAVTNFASPLALVAANLPDYKNRLKILKNLWEEHGEGNLDDTHGATFTELVRRLTGNTNVNFPNAEAPVLLFNSTLDGICRHHHYMKGIAALGMIERMFADISHFIGTAIVERGWLPNERLIHYTVHQKLDTQHAEDFFSIVRPHYDTHRDSIDEGLMLGALTFLQLYQQLREKSRKA
ncbi:MAG: TenA family transcriptional regulator [Bacteriovoracaceae bacterium]